MEYQELLKTKEHHLIDSGFEHAGGWSWLYPFQQYCVIKALLKGRFSLFEDCGLGKTRQQITWAYEVQKFTGRPVIIFAPLAVVPQTINEGNKIGIEVSDYDCELYHDQLESIKAGIYITNYEQLENVNASVFSGIVSEVFEETFCGNL